MYFFKTNRTNEELQETLKIVSIKQWWISTRDEYTKFKGLATYQTHLLDKTIAALDIQVKNGVYEYKLDQLKVLYTQLSNWESIHAIRFRSSHRSIQVEILKSWLEERIYFSNCTDVNLPIKYQETVSGAMKDLGLKEPNQQLELNKQSLYYWWKAKSNLGFFSWRTKATKELDELIYWYSTNVIIDNLDALQKIMEGIHVWLNERQNVSHPSRVAAVINLKKIITLEMARELQVLKQNTLINNSDNTLDNLI
ncbi:hypothetical protein ACQUW5_11515 [Legionella sp. CNM-1927-20]|uniref:hypothetical protein n=1 Tax=Legionella sp. CNM-1927-20 TaxID=3422221 RepID=UPI00403ABD7E